MHFFKKLDVGSIPSLVESKNKVHNSAILLSLPDLTSLGGNRVKILKSLFIDVIVSGVATITVMVSRVRTRSDFSGEWLYFCNPYLSE